MSDLKLAGRLSLTCRLIYTEGLFGGDDPLLKDNLARIMARTGLLLRHMSSTIPNLLYRM